MRALVEYLVPGAVTCLTLSLMGCGNYPSVELPENSPPAISNHLLASVTVKEGNVFEFYETSPGHILVSELGRYPNPPLAESYGISGMPLTQAYQVLAPGDAVPQSLLAAEQRALQAAGNPPPVESGSAQGMGTDASQRPTIPVALPGTPSGIGVKQFALTSTALWFESTFCNNSGAAYQWCLLDWWNGAYQYCNNFHYIRGTVYADTGDVTLIVSGTYGAQLSVGQGYYRYYWADGGSSGRVSERYEVANASGKRYDFGGYCR